jgi:transcriptional regulator with XRE-family HTH domain
MQKKPSFAGQFLKSYRENAYGLTQEQLARDLLMEPRTLRAYESGERQLTNVNELRRIADVLGVPAEHLGVATLDVLRTTEDIETIITASWMLVEESRLIQARIMIENLAQQLRAHISTEHSPLLRNLAETYHAAGYIVSEATHAKQSYEAILYYKEMETIARLIKDETMLNIALTYQGDMYRRLGNEEKSITYLEAARDTTPLADNAAKGNGIQLLARVYFKRNELEKFDRAMKQAEELSYTFDAASSSTRGHYSPGTVYEDWGRGYADLGKTQEAMDYLEKAECHLPKTKFWELLMKTSRAIALVKGNNIREGIELAATVCNESREAGILRYIDRIRSIDRYLEDKERSVNTARRFLQDSLYGDGVF